MREIFQGNDNYGKPKSEYLNKLSGLDDKQLYDECRQMIWLSAYARNNSRSDYHWQCDACYEESQTREDNKIYDRAYNDEYKANFG